MADDIKDYEELEEGTEIDTVDPIEDSETLESEIEANEKECEDLIREPQISPEGSEIRTTFIVDDVEDFGVNIFDGTDEENAEEMIANGESFIALAEETEVDDLATLEDIEDSEAREQLGVAPEEETTLADILTDSTFVTAPSVDEQNTVVIEKFEDEKENTDYDDASTYGDKDVDGDNESIPAGEKWWK